MHTLKYLALLAVAAGLSLLAVPKAHAQVSFGINIGPAPVCPYGYFDYAPYNCAPYGYYGPTWFNNGIFIGSGPWYHGPRRFYGRVDNRFDPRHGYRGGFPRRGERDHFRGYGRGDRGFHGNERRGGYDRGGHGGDRGGHGDHGDHGHGH